MRDVGTTDYRGKDRVQSDPAAVSMTVQSDAHLADINTILREFSAGGLAALADADLAYKDISEFTDLADALNQAKQAELEFMKLPSKVRQIFEHDVAVWLDTAHDPEKRDALVTAGFIKEAVQGGEIAGGAGGTTTAKPSTLEGGAEEPPAAPAAPAAPA